MSLKRARSCAPVSSSEFTICDLLTDEEIGFLVNELINETDLNCLFKDCENVTNYLDVLRGESDVGVPLVPKVSIVTKSENSLLSRPLMKRKFWARTEGSTKSRWLDFFKANCVNFPMPWENPWMPKTKGSPIPLAFHKKRISLPLWWSDICYDQKLELKTEILYETFSQRYDGVFNISGQFCKIRDEELIPEGFYLCMYIICMVCSFDNFNKKRDAWCRYGHVEKNYSVCTQRVFFI